MSENVNLIIQIIAAGGVIVSVVYLAIQINQQNKITRAQFFTYDKTEYLATISFDKNLKIFKGDKMISNM